MTYIESIEEFLPSDPEERIAALEARLNDLMDVKLHSVEGSDSPTVATDHFMAFEVYRQIAIQFIDSGAKNFIEMTLTPPKSWPEGYEIGPLCLCVQRVKGKTPGELIEESRKLMEDVCKQAFTPEGYYSIGRMESWLEETAIDNGLLCPNCHGSGESDGGIPGIPSTGGSFACARCFGTGTVKLRNRRKGEGSESDPKESA